MARFRIEHHEVDPTTRIVIAPDGAQTRLEPKVMDVLCELARRPGDVVPREDLADAVWALEAGSDEGVTRAISHLRKVLGDRRGAARIIETVPKRGYRLRVRPEDAGGPARVAVAPLKASDEAAWTRAACEALSDAIAHALAGVEGIELASRSGAGALAMAGLGVSAFRDRLQADRVVEGRLHRNGQGMHVFLEVCDTRDGRQVWSEIIDLTDLDLPEAQRVTGQKARAGLCKVLRLIPEERTGDQRAPANISAYTNYLLGRYFWDRDNDNPALALEHFHEAVREDPNLSSAYGGLVDCYCTFGLWQLMPQAEARRCALTFAEQAARLGPAAPESLFALGYARFYAAWDLEAADDFLHRAVEAAPGDAKARAFLALLLSTRGRLEEAVAEAQRAVAVDSVSRLVTFLGAVVHYYARDFQSAAEIASQGLAITADFVPNLWVAGASLARSGRPDDARALADRIEREFGAQDAALTYAVKIRAAAGDHEAAADGYDALMARHQKRGVSPLWLTGAQLVRGRNQKALGEMRRAFDERNMAFHHLIRDPNSDLIREEPAFQDMESRYLQAG